MKPLMITADLTALGVIFGAAFQILPAIAGLLACVWYGFVIYDRIRYGPDLSNRVLGRLKREEDAANKNG